MQVLPPHRQKLTEMILTKNMNLYLKVVAGGLLFPLQYQRRWFHSNPQDAKNHFYCLLHPSEVVNEDPLYESLLLRMLKWNSLDLSFPISYQVQICFPEVPHTIR